MKVVHENKTGKNIFTKVLLLTWEPKSPHLVSKTKELPWPDCLSFMDTCDARSIRIRINFNHIAPTMRDRVGQLKAHTKTRFPPTKTMKSSPSFSVTIMFVKIRRWILSIINIITIIQIVIIVLIGIIVIIVVIIVLLFYYDYHV